MHKDTNMACDAHMILVWITFISSGKKDKVWPDQYFAKAKNIEHLIHGVPVVALCFVILYYADGNINDLVINKNIKNTSCKNASVDYGHNYLLSAKVTNHFTFQISEKAHTVQRNCLSVVVGCFKPAHCLLQGQVITSSKGHGRPWWMGAAVDLI